MPKLLQISRSGQNSLDDVCCPWETSSSVKSDRTTSTDRIHRIEPVSKQLSVKSDKSDKVASSTKKQKSLDDQSSKIEDKSVSKKIPIQASPSSLQQPQPVELSASAPTTSTFVPPQLQKQLSKQSSDASKKSQEVVGIVPLAQPESPPSTSTLVAAYTPSTGYAIAGTSGSQVTSASMNQSSIEAVDEQVPSTSTNISTSVVQPADPPGHEGVKTGEKSQPEAGHSQNPSQKVSHEKELKKQLSRKKSTPSTSSAEIICPWDCE